MMLNAARAAAVRCGATVALSGLFETAPGIFRNTTRIFDRSGNVAGEFYKQHLPGTEKHVGTLSPLMQTPASLFCVFLGMSVLNIVAGLISSGLSLCYAQFVFDIDLSAANFLSVIVIVMLTVFSLTGFGMMIGSVGLRLRTSSIIANIVSYVGLLICGVNFPLSYLPQWVQAVASALPLTYGVNAMRGAVDGAGLSSIYGDLLMMAGLGLLYLAISWVLFRMFEKMARNSGAYDMF